MPELFTSVAMHLTNASSWWKLIFLNLFDFMTRVTTCSHNIVKLQSLSPILLHIVHIVFCRSLKSFDWPGWAGARRAARLHALACRKKWFIFNLFNLIFIYLFFYLYVALPRRKRGSQARPQSHSQGFEPRWLKCGSWWTNSWWLSAPV